MPSNPNQKSRMRDNNPGQQLYHALCGMGGASLTNEVPWNIIIIIVIIIILL